MFLVFSPSCFNILEQTKITVLGIMNKARLPHACSEVQRPSRGNPSTLASPGKCPLPLPPGREHTHTTGKESMRRFRLKFYPHQLKNLPTESWKDFPRVSIRLWAVFCYVHHLGDLHAPRSQSAGSPSNYSRNKEFLPQEPPIWFKTRYQSKKKRRFDKQMDWGRKNERDMWLPTIGRLLSFLFFFFFLIKINISNPHWPPA